MNARDPKLTALQFNDCINNRDIRGLASLMSEDYTFIDREDVATKGKESMTKGWIEFFKTFPKYKNNFSQVESRGNLVILVGYAYWSENNKYDPAI